MRIMKEMRRMCYSMSHTGEKVKKKITLLAISSILDCAKANFPEEINEGE
jgi:hypothetical protein